MSKKFSFTIGSEHLSRGLRPSKRMPRNSRFLVECNGAVGRDGVLEALDELTRINTTVYVLNFDEQTGSFTAGNTVYQMVSGAVTAYATILNVSQSGGSGTLYLIDVSGTFVDDAIIYEATFGSELVTDGDCSSDSFVTQTGWSYDAVNQEYDCDGSQEIYTSIIQSIGVPDEGDFYRILFTIKNLSAGDVYVHYGKTSSGWYDSNGSKTAIIQCSDPLGNANVHIYAREYFVGSIDDVSVKQITNAALVNGTASLLNSFPYPQIFVFTNVTIVCTETMIFEWVSGALVHKLTVSAGSTWVALDFYDYVYLSNGNVAVVRDAGDKTYSETSDLPTAMAAFNFNGQVILGSPDAGYES